MWEFYKALFKNPRAVGAVMPSSPYLAKKIASFIPPDINGKVIELGAGTGAITRAILRHGIAHHQLIAVDASLDLTTTFHAQFPQVKIIHGNAEHLSDLLKDISGPIQAIISSLPLLNTKMDLRNSIIQEIEKVLSPNGYYIQYTYGAGKSAIELTEHFKKIASVRVWLNVPPARVDVFQFAR